MNIKVSSNSIKRSAEAGSNNPGILKPLAGSHSRPSSCFEFALQVNSFRLDSTNLVNQALP
jgi:hypothetical protein